MKNIIIFLSFMFFTLNSFSQDFPDISMEETSSLCSTNSSSFDGTVATFDFFSTACGKWRNISGSADYISRKANGVTTKGFRIGTGRTYPKICPINNPSCTSAEKIPCLWYNKNGGEGLMYKGATFKKGVKYYLSMNFSIELTAQQINNNDTQLDYAGIKLSNNATDITPQCQFGNDCSDSRPLFESISTFTSLSGQEIWNGAGQATGQVQRTEICFTPDQDYTQLLFFVYESVPFKAENALDGISDANRGKVIFLNVDDLKVTCCRDNAEYTGTDLIPFYPSSTYNGGLVTHLQLPLLTEVKNKISIYPSLGNIVIKSTEYVILRAGSKVEFKRPINGKKFIVERGGSYKVQMQACSSCSSNENCFSNYAAPNSVVNTLPSGETGPFARVFVPNLFDPSQSHPNPLYHRFTPTTSPLYYIPYNANYAKLEVFNRWGGLVYRGEDKTCNGSINPLNISWDGCFNGQPAIAETYTYTLVLRNCYATEVKAGSVNLYSPKSSCTNFRSPNEDPSDNNYFAANNHSKNISKNIISNSKGKMNKDGLSNNYEVETVTNKSNNFNNDLFVYPNPSTDKIFLMISNRKGDYYDIQLVDVTGKTLDIVKKNAYMDSSTQIEINVQDFPMGYYMIKAISKKDHSSLQQKFVKQ
jgi:Secretion system C-terminal sorting domain/CHU_C Type IX secretion signal domain